MKDIIMRFSVIEDSRHSGYVVHKLALVFSGEPHYCGVRNVHRDFLAFGSIKKGGQLHG